MRHDARTGGQFGRVGDEIEILVQEHRIVHRKPGQRGGYRGHGLRHDPFGFPASHLGVYHVVTQRVEAEQLGGHRAVERERRAVTGR